MKLKQLIAPTAGFCALLVALLWSFSSTQVQSPEKIQKIADQMSAGRSIATESK